MSKLLRFPAVLLALLAALALAVSPFAVRRLSEARLREAAQAAARAAVGGDDAAVKNMLVRADMRCAGRSGAVLGEHTLSIPPGTGPAGALRDAALLIAHRVCRDAGAGLPVRAVLLRPRSASSGGPATEEEARARAEAELSRRLRGVAITGWRFAPAPAWVRLTVSWRGRTAGAAAERDVWPQREKLRAAYAAAEAVNRALGAKSFGYTDAVRTYWRDEAEVLEASAVDALWKALEKAMRAKGDDGHGKRAAD